MPRSVLEGWEDLCMNGLKNTIETYGLLEPNPPPFQNPAMRRVTIRMWVLVNKSNLSEVKFIDRDPH